MRKRYYDIMGTPMWQEEDEMKKHHFVDYTIGWAHGQSCVDYHTVGPFYTRANAEAALVNLIKIPGFRNGTVRTLEADEDEREEDAA